MINGQLNATSQQTVTPLAALEPPPAMADGGNFAGLLSGIQAPAKVNALPGAGQAEQFMNENGKDQLPLDGGTENPAIDLLALFQVSPQIAATSETAAQKSEDSEKTDVTADAVPLSSEPSDITSQMALAAYSQPGRIPEVNTPTTLPVDTLQKAATVTEYLQPGRMPEVNIPTTLPVDPLQKAATLTEQPAPIVTTPIEKLAGKLAAEVVPSAPSQPEKQSQPVPHSVVAVTVLADASQAVKSDRMSDVNIPAPLPVDTRQKAAAVTEQTALIAAQADNIQAKQLAAAVLAGNSPAASVQEAHTARQLINPEQQLEKGRSGSEPAVVKEMATVQQSAASTGETSMGSDTPQSGDSNQMLEQQMRGQLSTEHQKVASLSAKEVLTESVQQDIPEQITHQVKARLLQHDLKQGSQQITLTLSPDSLGELKMSLNLQGQKLSVEILTENRTVRDAIVLHADALKDSLARQNITMESFDVTTGGKGSGGQGQNQNAWRDLAKEQQQQQLWSSPRGYNTAQAELPSGQAAYQRQQGQSMLDIHY